MSVAKLYWTRKRSSAAPAWFVISFVTLGVAIAAVLVAMGLRSHPQRGRSLDTAGIAAAIQAHQTSSPGQDATVTCPPSEPFQTGKIFDCTLVNNGTTVLVRVTEDDAEGHYHWQITDQTPMGGFSP